MLVSIQVFLKLLNRLTCCKELGVTMSKLVKNVLTHYNRLSNTHSETFKYTK